MYNIFKYVMNYIMITINPLNNKYVHLQDIDTSPDHLILLSASRF